MTTKSTSRPVTSRPTYALLEAERHLDANQRGRLAELVQKMEIVPDVTKGALPEGITLPEKDAPILAAAIAAGATHLITGDRRDFGARYGETFGGVLVLPPREYLSPGVR